MIAFNDTITIWNCWRNPATKKDEWFRHVLTPCNWTGKVEIGVSGTGAIAGNVFNVLIAQLDGYLDRNEWEALPHEERPLHWMLSPGDLVALGNVQKVITGIDPFTESQLKADLLPNAFTIKAVTDNAATHKHGKHYKVTGV